MPANPPSSLDMIFVNFHSTSGNSVCLFVCLSVRHKTNTNKFFLAFSHRNIFQMVFSIQNFPPNIFHSDHHHTISFPKFAIFYYFFCCFFLPAEEPGPFGGIAWFRHKEADCIRIDLKWAALGLKQNTHFRCVWQNDHMGRFKSEKNLLFFVDWF